MTLVLPTRVENGAMPAPDVVLAHLLKRCCKSRGRIQRRFETDVPIAFVVSCIFHEADTRVADVPEVLIGDACIQTPLPTLSDSPLNASDVRVITIATIFIVARTMREKCSLCLFAEASVFAEDIKRAADRIRSKWNAALAFDQFEVIDSIGVNGIPVLHRTSAPGGIVQAHAIE